MDENIVDPVIEEKKEKIKKRLIEKGKKKGAHALSMIFLPTLLNNDKIK